MSALAGLGTSALAAWTALAVGYGVLRIGGEARAHDEHRARVLALFAASAFFAVPWLAAYVPAFSAPALHVARIGAGASANTSAAAHAESLLARVPWRALVAAAGAAWTLLATLGLLRVVVQRVQLSRLLRASSPAPAWFAREVPIPARVTHARATPFVVGFVRPTLVVAQQHLETLDERERSLLVMHELAHVARGDTRVDAVVPWLAALFFGHPLAARLVREIAFHRECAVDERVLAQCDDAAKRAYANLLLTCAETTAPLMVSAAVDRSHLARRLSMFTNSLSASRSQKRRSLLPLLLGLALVACGARAATPPASTRAPAAQEQVARAELTLENDDLHDVMYRPGEQKISIKLSPRAVASMRDAFAGRYPVHVHIRHTDTNLLLRTPPTTDVMQITARSPEELALLFKEITGVDAP